MGEFYFPWLCSVRVSGPLTARVQFVNPPRLQSVPGFSHFHVFARRKTPEEIDAAEHIWGKAPSIVS